MGRTEYRDDEFIQTISGNIKRILNEKGITQETFLFDTGLHPNRVLTGKTNMSVSTLKKVSDYLEVPPTELIK